MRGHRVVASGHRAVDLVLLALFACNDQGCHPHSSDSGGSELPGVPIPNNGIPETAGSLDDPEPWVCFEFERVDSNGEVQRRRGAQQDQGPSSSRARPGGPGRSFASDRRARWR
jgi:hypothetical protein